MTGGVLIVGYGYVGKAFAKLLSRRYEVSVYDPYVDSTGDYKRVSEEELEGTHFDLAVICVPTESTENGGCNTTLVEESVGNVEADLIVIKSTVKPGTTDKLQELYPEKHIVFSPEYVGEGKYVVSPRMDFQTDPSKTPFLICGGKPDDVRKVFDLFIPILGPEKHYYPCTAKEAELIKYMENTYFAMKVTFANEMYEIAQAMNVSWYRVWQGWALDPRVDVMHTAIFPESRGFGGKCLPKDTNALVASAAEHGYLPHFLLEMLKSNARFNHNEPVRVKAD